MQLTRPLSGLTGILEITLHHDDMYHPRILHLIDLTLYERLCHQWHVMYVQNIIAIITVISLVLYHNPWWRRAGAGTTAVNTGLKHSHTKKVCVLVDYKHLRVQCERWIWAIIFEPILSLWTQTQTRDMDNIMMEKKAKERCYRWGIIKTLVSKRK